MSTSSIKAEIEVVRRRRVGIELLPRTLQETSPDRNKYFPFWHLAGSNSCTPGRERYAVGQHAAMRP